MLPSMGSQRIKHNRATEQQQIYIISLNHCDNQNILSPFSKEKPERRHLMSEVT